MWGTDRFLSSGGYVFVFWDSQYKVFGEYRIDMSCAKPCKMVLIGGTQLTDAWREL